MLTKLHKTNREWRKISGMVMLIGGFLGLHAIVGCEGMSENERAFMRLAGAHYATDPDSTLQQRALGEFVYHEAARQSDYQNRRESATQINVNYNSREGDTNSTSKYDEYGRIRWMGPEEVQSHESDRLLRRGRDIVNGTVAPNDKEFRLLVYYDTIKKEINENKREDILDADNKIPKGDSYVIIACFYKAYINVAGKNIKVELYQDNQLVGSDTQFIKENGTWIPMLNLTAKPGAKEMLPRIQNLGRYQARAFVDGVYLGYCDYDIIE